MKHFEPGHPVSSIGDEDLLIVYERGIVDAPHDLLQRTKKENRPERDTTQQSKVKYTEDSEIVEGESMTSYIDRENRFTYFQWPEESNFQKNDGASSPFALGSRVDAKDFKDTWYSGSVVALDKGKFKVHFLISL